MIQLSIKIFGNYQQQLVTIHFDQLAIFSLIQQNEQFATMQQCKIKIVIATFMLNLVYVNMRGSKNIANVVAVSANHWVILSITEVVNEDTGWWVVKPKMEALHRSTSETIQNFFTFQQNKVSMEIVIPR